MSDDLEQRLRTTFRQASLPVAPATLVDALERIPDAPVVRRRRIGRSTWAPLAVAAALAVAAVVAISGGQRGITPGPTATPSPQPTPTLSPVPVGVLRVVYQAQPVGDVRPIAGDMDAIATIVEDRLASASVTGAIVRVDGDDRLVVELPAAGDTDALRALIGQTGRLDFVPLGDTSKEVGDVIDRTVLKPLFGGDQIESAAVTDGQQGRTVSFVLKPQAAGIFADYTSTHIGQYFAIVLDSKVVSAPIINSEIPGGQVEISQGGVDGFSLEEAQSLVALMQFGVLPYPLVEISNEIVPAGPSPTAP
jgi:hypothetical protein